MTKRGGDPWRTYRRKRIISIGLRNLLVYLMVAASIGGLCWWLMGCTLHIHFHTHQERGAVEAGDAILDSIVEDLTNGPIEEKDVLGRPDNSTGGID